MTFTHYINWVKIRFVHRILYRPCKLIEKNFSYFLYNAFIVKEIKNLVASKYEILNLFFFSRVNHASSQIFMMADARQAVNLSPIGPPDSCKYSLPQNV